MAEESIGLMEASAEEPTESTGGPDFGTDLLEDEDQPTASSEGTGPSTPSSGSTAAGDAVDLTTADPDSLPSHLKPAAEYIKRFQQDYTRKTMDLADQRRSLEQTQAGIQQERQQYLDALNQTPQASPEDPVQALYDALPEEDRRGLSTVDQLVDHRIKAALGNGALEDVSQIRSELNAMKEMQTSGRVREIQSELAEARTEYGDLVDQYSDLLVTNYGQINPNTSQPFTVTEIMGLFSGRTADAAQSARAEDQKARSSSKRKTASRAQTASAGTNGDISDAEASDLIAQLDGFTT